jgi:SAM-dependent methyltransferase
MTGVVRVADDLRATFGDIDIYLFDQLLRDRIRTGMRVLDAGCGWGRNLVYLLRSGFDVRAADADAAAVAAVRRLAADVAPHLPEQNFRIEPIEAMSFEPASADVVISSAVLHFARDPDHFDAMLRGSWRMLAPGGLFFCRLASSIGMEARIRPIGSGRYRLPDGSDRFLVDEATLMRYTAELGGRLLDPVKTTVVQGQRSMTTWVLESTKRSDQVRGAR